MIYVLSLKDDFFYVGSSSCIEKRIAAHFNGNGSVWTSLHPPVSVFAVLEEEKNDFAEDNVTLHLMHRYGIHRVRGGSFTSIILCKEDISCISRQLATAFKLCFKCHGTGHLAGFCPKR